jgi:Domain of unknown function (DUF4198)
LLNGTFQQSEGVVKADRFKDVNLVASKLNVPLIQAISLRNEGKTTIIDVTTGDPGTYVVGLSTYPREIGLKAADFNDYLEHDGLPDTLEQRKQKGELGKDVRERYSKHVRAVFQVGDKLTDDYKKAFGYPVEIIPQQNPYSLHVGQTITALCTREGQPLANQFVIAGWESSAGKMRTLDARTDTNGLVKFKLEGAGKWFIKMIHMTVLGAPNLDYESRWATVTFEIREAKAQ